ncbi:hypothetical protein INF35_00560 [Subdoligranulum sp. DSM 109015]|uniref:RanBP2-type domain-containing protein n=1 Tax=Gemmiger gallinarum TaxID=2779354 RepID=A0ABR9QZJ1_9FIRM|nr:hypothetical protein [Gemmiger gallinarum]MBE5036299.1 hypothetical protein [Gemmiger gallinarum]
MDQNFSLMAQSRANYYTAGSPVQFVRVELLKGDVTGEVAVCLTFKNVGTEPLTGLVIHFKCKDAAGQVLCEDDFYYEQLDAQPGDLFGSDDAVYVSDTPVSSVEIEQDRAFLNGRGVDLRGYKRVRLKTPRVLPASIAKTLQQRTGNDALICVPQDIEQGWFCACGAFHPNEENTQVCSECGGDRAYIKAALTHVLEEARQAAEQQQREINAVANSDPQQEAAAATAAAAQAAIAEEPTAQFAPPQQESNPELDRVRRYANKGILLDDEQDDDEDGTRMFDAEEASGELDYDGDYDEDDEDEYDRPRRRGRYADDSEESEDDVMAERIIRWAPPITAVICALIIAVAVIYRFLIA